MQSVLVLVVEDEPLLLDTLKAMLQDGGFEVADASDGEQAVEMLDGNLAGYRALVTDVNLVPGKLTGWDVARHARELVPELPVIYTSGASADQWASMGVPNSMFIHKPYAAAQITTAIAQLLNAGGPAPAA